VRAAGRGAGSGRRRPRGRLHEVTQRLAQGERVEWAALADELGFADQAHLVRDVTGVFGEPPTRYAARYRGTPRPARRPVPSARSVGAGA
jgi:AraC-like DNA-binding protein